MPTATLTETATAPSATAGTTRRKFRTGRRGGGGGSSVRTRSRSAREATGRAARSSRASCSKRSSTSSKAPSGRRRPKRPCGLCPCGRLSGDTGAHLLLQLLQGAAEPGRARARADPEHTGGTLAVQLEHDPQRDHLALGGRQARERPLEAGREPFAEDRLLTLTQLGHHVSPLAAAPALLRAEVVERRGAGELAQPRTCAAPARVVA